MDTIFSQLYGEIAAKTCAGDVAIAKRYGLPLVEHEGGDHLNAVALEREGHNLSPEEIDTLSSHNAGIVRKKHFEQLKDR